MSTAIQPPESWYLYFPGNEYKQNDRRAHLIGELVEFFNSEQGWEQLSTVRQYQNTYVVDLDYVVLCAGCGSSDVQDALSQEPVEALDCLGAAMYETLFANDGAIIREFLQKRVDRGKVTARLFNHPKSQVHIRQLKSNSLGRLVTISGTVVRLSPIRPLITSLEFVCAKCRTAIERSFPDGRYSPPTKCAGDNCRSRSFEPSQATACSVDWQKIRVQEILGADKQEEGRIPRTVEVEMTNDLVDACMAGDVVTIMGVVKVINAESENTGKAAGKRSQCLFILYLEAVSVASKRGPENKVEREDLAGAVHAPNIPDFSMKDLEFIVAFSQMCAGDQFRQVIHAMCPAIYGHELIKAGMILSLFGGVRKKTGGGGSVPVRGDVHMLIVGDPGLGKSQLLQAASAAAPRGVYICGNTSTSTGLTVSVVKDNLSGDFVFEAGALVLADGGVCCVDEFDKMTTEHQALLEAMEQQEVSVAKAGLVANLPARTTVIAAANPVGGHYSRAKTVQENLKLSNAMLSRFDLVFVLMDVPDVELDKKLSEHVMALHSGGSKATQQRNLTSRSQQQSLTNGQNGSNGRKPLAERLKLRKEESSSLIPVKLLRKYIAYARQYASPKLSDGAKQVLQKFYLQLRQSVSASEGTPITARQLESLVRLAEARAKVELREVVTKEDAEDVIELMKEVLYDNFVDESGMIRFRQAAGRGKQNEAKRFLGALAMYADKNEKSVVTMADIYSVADEIELQVEDIRDFVEKLNNEGELLKRGPQLYKAPRLSSSTQQRNAMF